MAFPASAQVNIEQYRNRPGVSGKVGLQFGGAKGNTDFVTGGGAANISYNTGTYAVLLLGKGLLGFSGGKRFSNEGLTHLRYTWIKPHRFHPEGFAQIDYSRPRKLKFRVLAGAGLRAQVAEGESSSIFIGTSFMWERENLDLTSGSIHLHRTSILRTSNYVNVSIQKHAEISLTGYYQAMLSDLDDVRILATLEITSKIVGPLQHTTALNYRRDSKPPDGIKKNDLALGTSFSVRFGSKEKK